MTTYRTANAASRRAAIAGLGAGGIGLALAARGALAQEEGGDLAAHPLVGTWAVMTMPVVVPQIHGADGSFIAAFPPNYVDPALGLTFQGPGLGRWESTGERSGRFTFLHALTDASGAYVGSFQLAAELDVSEDGQTWSGAPTAHIVVRDATNTVTFDQEIPIDPPVTATRMGATIDSVVLPAVRPTAATPEP